MGDIYLETTLANLRDLEKQKEISFLVDTGATRAWIPREIAEELEIDMEHHTISRGRAMRAK